MENSTEDFDFVVETLTAMFSNVISKEVIIAVVESCDGDLNLAAENIMNISTDANPKEMATDSKNETIHNTTPEPTNAEDNSPHSTSLSVNPNTFAQTSNQLLVSYVNASRSTGAVPKLLPKPRYPSSLGMVWTDQLRKIITYHNQGSRILILMRGAPGSGKTHLAKQIIEITIGATNSDYLTHICSTDDFFMVRGQYVYQKYRLSEAHDWNQNRVRLAMRQGLSPIIIDNTNIEIWEMEPYVREGIRNGYIIEVVEANTPWARKANQLFKKNTHKVPIESIKRMLNNYQDGITGEFLKKYYGLSYPADMVPPVIRSIPVYVPVSSSASTLPESVQSRTNESNQSIKIIDPQTSSSTKEAQNEVIKLVDYEVDPEIKAEVETVEERLARQQRYLEIQKQLEEIEKVEKDWENGESWGEETQAEKETATGIDEISEPLKPMPQRRTISEGSTPRDNLLETVQKCEDWRHISMFMSPWSDDTSTQRNQSIEIPVRETISSGTCMEIGDTDLQNPKKVLKVMTATSRDINLFHIHLPTEKIPNKRMLDKSTTTNEILITQAYRCKNEEQHFVAFRKLFKNIPRPELRDIFDKCCGDVNWAVDIVLSGMTDNQLEMIDRDDISDTEEEIVEQCNCLAGYNVIPDVDALPSTGTSTTATLLQNIPINLTETSIQTPKKAKITPSDSTLQLKREIERNFVISDEHYAQHTLKIKKWREGDYLDENCDRNVSLQTPSTENITVDQQPSTSKEIGLGDNQVTKDSATCPSDDEESNTSSLDDAERTININLGSQFVAQLDDLFGRKGMTYPENVVPKINIPISLLTEINAFWMESLMCQLDEQDKQNTRMLREDAEFARQLALKEQELAQQGKEPEVPDFKEIMDMDFAMSLYQKDVAEWRNKEPTDLAAKLSRDKLYNLFPDMCPDLLSELLMAHDNNFQATVESLLMSTGRTDILEQKNGLNKFVIEKEMERQEKLLEEENKALSEVEWPLLPEGEKVEMSTVNSYREEAEKHLARRNLSYQKAQDYIRRGMTQVANYYSDIASFHKKKYEQANSLAAASLMQVHAANCTDNATIDLHYLRVGEAKESLDLFLDTHIQKLRESTNRHVRHHTLFFITGRGLHSNGRPRVKPAVKKRLRERGIVFTERNPGLLTARVCADDKLSYQLVLP